MDPATLAPTDLQLGQAVYLQRIRRNWTQERLTKAAGINVSTVSLLEAGRPLELTTLRRVAMAFGVRAGDLLNEASARDWAIARPAK